MSANSPAPSDQKDAPQALVERLFASSMGALELMSIYIGDKLGYYRALSQAQGGLTSRQLAQSTDTNERYAREWLEQQAANEFIAVSQPSEDPLARRYSLPVATADVFLNESSLFYFAPMAKVLVAAASQADRLLEAYRTGGGVSWAQYGPDMRDAQAAFNRPMYMNLLAKEYLSSVPDIDRKLNGSGRPRVADIACGGGWSSIAIAQHYPKVRVDGFDLDEPSIEMARANAETAGVDDRVKFHHEDASNTKLSGKYDLVTIFEALHDMPQPVAVLETARRLAGNDGIVLVMDEAVADKFEAPANPIDRFMYGASIVVCLPDGMSHQPSAATGTVMRPATLRKYAQEAGFKNVEVLPIQNDFFRFYRLHQ